MKKFLALIILISTVLTATSCDKYVNSFKAIGLIRSNTSQSCFAKFHSLEGQLVFKLKKSGDGEGAIKYSVTAEEGEITIYYDALGEKEELVNVKAGESVDSSGGYVEGGQRVYIIIEAKDASKGEVSVELDD
jgi:hypothetical protein